MRYDFDVTSIFIFATFSVGLGTGVVGSGNPRGWFAILSGVGLWLVCLITVFIRDIIKHKLKKAKLTILKIRKCPLCDTPMKENILSYRCRNTSCMYTIDKISYFDFSKIMGDE